MVLALAFDAQTPFRLIRAQASQLARALETEPNGSVSLPKLHQEVPGAASHFPESATLIQEEDEEKAIFPSLESSGLLTDVPPANPGRYQSKNNSGVSSLEALLKQFPNLEEDPGGGLEDAPQVDSQDSFSKLPAKPIAESEKIEFLPAQPAVYHLAFTCILIPRMPHHHLTGDLANQLPGWVAQLCLAFGWRLEHLSLQPEYLQWVVQIPPTTSPSYHMRILRTRTSERIFASFPDIAQENPSNDFWAPGYLIMTGVQVSHSMIQEYIQQIRHQQGASSSYLPSQYRR